MENIKEWASIDELLNEADKLQTATIEWKGKKLRLYFKFLTEGETLDSQAAVLAAKTDAERTKATFEYTSEMVFKMLQKGNGVNGQMITKEKWDSMPRLVKDKIMMALMSIDQRETENFLVERPTSP